MSIAISTPIKKTIDLAVVSGIVIFSIPIILSLQVRPLVSSIFFFILPSAYLLVRNPRPLKRIFTGALLFGILFGFILDFVAIFNGAWSEPVEQLVFQYKIFTVVPIDHIIWFFFWALLIIVFYEYFIERDLSDFVSHNIRYAFLPSIAALISILIIYFTNPNFLKFNYAYFFLGLFTLAPFFYLAFKKPLLLIKFVKISPFFFFLFLIFELTALKLNQWYFPGEYIGTVTLFNLTFPFEEFFFWILMSSTVVLSYYELYVDDER